MPGSLADDFPQRHVPGEPLLLPNAWDLGSAKLFESMGFAAVATTSSGFAATYGAAAQAAEQVRGQSALSPFAEQLAAARQAMRRALGG